MVWKYIHLRVGQAYNNNFQCDIFNGGHTGHVNNSFNIQLPAQGTYASLNSYAHTAKYWYKLLLMSTSITIIINSCALR
jgi:hypothetical protein